MSPLVSFSTISRLFPIHSSYLMCVSDVTRSIRTVRSPSPLAAVATVSGMYAFSVALSIFS